MNLVTIPELRLHCTIALHDAKATDKGAADGDMAMTFYSLIIGDGEGQLGTLAI